MAQTERHQEHWECLYGTKYLYKVEILKSLMEENEIPCVIVNKQDSAYLFGDIELYVKQDDVLRAQKILQHFLDDE